MFCFSVRERQDVKLFYNTPKTNITVYICGAKINNTYEKTELPIITCIDFYKYI